MDSASIRRYKYDFLFSTVIMIIYRLTEYLTPLIQRKIHEEEVWLYKNPRTDSYVTSINNIIISITVPLTVFSIFYVIHRSKHDFVDAFLGVYFGAAFTGLVTNIMKNMVCRPRPDFFERCFPDGVYKANMPVSCIGSQEAIIEGMKSFPSGHSSQSFISLGYTALYLAGKLHCFSARGRHASWRVLVASVPLLLALVIAISRTADYHHHWQDVLVGSCLGMTVAYITYRNRFPALSKTVSHLPYSVITPMSTQLQLQRQESVFSPSTPTTDSESMLKLVVTEDSVGH